MHFSKTGSTAQQDLSCSDCQLEFVTKTWTKLIIRWINRCINPELHAKILTPRCLTDIVNRYKEDICEDDIDKAILLHGSLEPFLRHKYPILRLSRYFPEDKDEPRKLLIMSSVLLYHCCIVGQSGAVERDLCEKMTRMEREMVLKFCERLGDMEMTINNVDIAIKAACEITPSYSKVRRSPTPYVSKSNTDCGMDSAPTTPNSSFKRIKAKKVSTLTFKSVTVMPSRIMTDNSSFSKTTMNDASSLGTLESYSYQFTGSSTGDSVTAMGNDPESPAPGSPQCLSNIEHIAGDLGYVPTEGPEQSVPCACEQCSTDVCCGRPDCFSSNMSKTNANHCPHKTRFSTQITSMLCKCGDVFKCAKRSTKCVNMKCLKITFLIIFVISLLLLIAAFIYIVVDKRSTSNKGLSSLSSSSSKLGESRRYGRMDPLQAIPTSHSGAFYPTWAWLCKDSLCIKVYQPRNDNYTYSALSRCILLCTGPQLWPQPIGLTYFSKELVALATDRLEYKFQALPSDIVNQYLAEAFKLFLGDLARLERIDIKGKNRTRDIEVKKMHILIEVDTDSDPRLRVNTDESYYLKMITDGDKQRIHISSPSFCGVRHGLETLSQVILLDQATGYLITLSEIVVKDAPSYRYRGLMLDTARNYIPVPDILRTIDGMASCKLNTFHWRISDSASFPLLLPTLSNLFEYGAYDRSMVYTKDDVKTIVSRAGVRGIRVLIEIALPGPVGRAWSWSDDATCPKKNDNYTCENVICLRLKMQDQVFVVLQHLYSEIIDMTGVDDIFHLSDSVFSLSNCYYLLDEREGFLERALERLKLANKGFLPKLPIIWYTSHLNKDMESKSWERLGVQIYEWPSHPDRSLSTFKVIHSSRWDLSCDVKKQRCTKYRSWQEMYAWKSWRTIDVFSNEGGEALLWTDLVDSGNLDFHLWPRAAAVAERLWSDMVANSTAGGSVFLRLDNHRWRMLLRGMKVQPVWPVWCSFNPHSCISKLQNWNKY